MQLTTLILLAFGLSMDAFAVSVSNAMCYSKLTHKQALFTSASFGFFQGLMPVIGFFAGQLLSGFIEAVDHWVALLLLGVIGGKMAYDGIKALRQPESCPAGAVFTPKTMLLQALATSIDALAVGISLSALSVNIFSASVIIGLITFTCCLFGSFLGKKFGAILGDWAEILGGVILIGIGLKIFIEHVWF